MAVTDRDALSLGLPVPLAGPTVCPRCRGPKKPAFVECWCCRHVGSALGEGPEEGPATVLARLCRPGDALHSSLRRYKDGPVAEARRHLTAVCSRLLDEVLGQLPGSWDAVCAVPSSWRGPVGGRRQSPVDAIVAGCRALNGVPLIGLERREQGCRHLVASSSAFAVPESVRGRNVLVVEDAWVTGSRARSAGAALTAQGASVTSMVVVGRVVEPTASPAALEWWAAHAAASGVGCAGYGVPAAGPEHTGGQRAEGSMR